MLITKYKCNQVPWSTERAQVSVRNNNLTLSEQYLTDFEFVFILMSFICFKFQVEPTRICFTHKEYRKLGGYKFQRLNPGNYSFRIKATSLAGNGSFTQPFFFVVPEIDGEQNIYLMTFLGFMDVLRLSKCSHGFIYLQWFYNCFIK